MKLYHFTAKHMASSIAAEGLNRGFVPLKQGDMKYLIPGFIWLTKKSSFEQSWCSNRVLLDYDRNDIRMEVHIPYALSYKLFSWEKAKARFIKQGYSVLEHFEDYGDPENWFLFRGSIARRYLSNFTPKQGVAA